MTSLKDQVSALLKKEYLVLKGTKNYIFQELFSPIFSLYFVWYSSAFPEGGMNLSPLTIPFVLGRVTFSLMFNVVQEKSQNFKEYLRVNGASLYSYMISIFIFYLIRAFLAMLIMYAGVIIFFTQESFTLTEHLLSFLSLVLYSIALINFSLALTTIFSSPRLACQVASLITILLTLVFFAVSATDKLWLYYVASLIPQVACAFGFKTLSTEIVNPAGFTQGEALLMQVANCFLYLILYVYLDSVVPSDSGIKDPIFVWKKRSPPVPIQETSDLEAGINSEHLLNESTATAGNQDVSSAEHHEVFYNPLGLKRTVFVDNITKVFGDNTAVDKVTLPMFERQIFCLLGHNGAGKTTTINMMTGMLRPEGGRILYEGENFAENFDKIRRKFGLCVQKDILYENLTVADHIEIISRLRGVPLSEIPQYTQMLSAKVGIPEEVSKKASELSGGTKRKLSLALAIAGETKVIFLDEPTSGLDPNARRNFWDLVRGLRDEGRTILLTTHNLDEADELADRIGIMSKGKLLVLGTSNFLKKKYGVGYNLIITPKPDEIQAFYANKERYVQYVKTVIQTSEVDTKTSPEMIKMSLPYHESSCFPALFRYLEKEPNIEVAMELNTLEDVFVNIGLQEEADIAAESGNEVIAPDQIPMPESLNQGFTYSFTKQVAAIFRRRFYCTFRNRTNYLQILMPIIYLVLSNILSTQASTPDPRSQILMFSIFSMIGFIINSVSYTAFPVHERETNIKYLLRTIGLRPHAYWIGTLLFDLLVVSALGIILVPMGIILGTPMISETLGRFLVIILSFGFSILNISYLLSWIYSKQATVYKFHILLFLFGLFYFPFFIFLFTVLERQGDATAFFAMFAFSFIISPPLMFTYAAFSFLDTPIFETDNEFLASLFSNSYFYGGVMILQGLVYFGLNYMVELKSMKLTPEIPQTTLPHPYADHIPNPQEIIQEEERVRNSQNQDLTKTIDLQKIYGTGFQALRGITFGVEQKQIFGLLGPNGAGKSTTFNILTGLIAKTSGHVIFNDNELTVLDPKIFETSGICPQFNALWDHLSLSEHLEIMGAIKGLEKGPIQEAIAYYAKILRMEEHLNKKAMQLSGGTKRKVCVANLLIGAPRVQFMDEPSTGLDPLSKRALYDTIIQNRESRNASIILTTHSMAEAESLCSKIGILINGKFVCMGTLPYLKSRYGTGYKVSVVKLNSKKDVYHQALLNVFPNAIKEQDQSEVFDNYRVTTQEFSFEKAFDLMEKLKENDCISDFNIMNTTLEQVFIQFSRNQRQESIVPT